LKKLAKMAQAPVAQTADRFSGKAKMSGDVVVSGFGIREKKHPDQLAAAFRKLIEDFPQKLFAFRAEINLERVGVWIRDAESAVFRILAAVLIFCANNVMAFPDRDGEDPGTKPGRVDERVEIFEDPTTDDLENFLSLVHIEVQPDGYGIDHSFVPPQQPFSRLRIAR
jgi:hypothetical protein